MSQEVQMPSSSLSGYTLYSQNEGVIVRNAFDASIRSIGRTSDKWNALLIFDFKNQERRDAYDTFVTKLNGRFNYFKLKPTEHIRKDAPGDKTVVYALNALRTRLAIDDTTGLEIGDHVRIGNQLVEIVGFDDTRASIYICPGLRNVELPTTMYTKDVWGLFRLEGNENNLTDYKYGMVPTQQTLEVTEYIQL